MANLENEEECVFRPAISHKSKAIERSVDDLFKWKEEKTASKANTALEFNTLGCTFNPQVNQKSAKIVDTWSYQVFK